MVHGKRANALPVLADKNLETLIDALRRDPEALAEMVSRAGPELTADVALRDAWFTMLRSELPAGPANPHRCEPNPTAVD